MSTPPFLDALASERKHNRQLVKIIYAVVLMGAVGAWFSWRQPKTVDVHLAPDLRAGDTVRVSDGRSPVPPTNVYGFSYYIWQQINRWQTDGAKDYGQQIYNMQFFLTPQCQSQLKADMELRHSKGELRRRTRQISEIPGFPYSENRVVADGPDAWTVLMDMQVMETFAGQPIKDVFIRYPLRVVRFDVDRARAAAQRAALRQVTPAPSTGPVERAVFAREPVRVQLQVGRERLITLPADALLHVPGDMETVARLQSIGGTIYVTALVPFTAIRIVAELVDSGQQIPFDLIAQQSTKEDGELQVAVMEPPTVPNPMAAGAAGGAVGGASAAAAPEPAADMVQLTRHAARQLYAPRRLAVGMPGVSQVAVDFAPVPGLMRGVSVVAQPVGQWKSGNLYVTAVRITNQSRFALELPLESIRGRWISATAQHGRIGAAGTDTDTTALYLVCDRTFAACL